MRLTDRRIETALNSGKRIKRRIWYGKFWERTPSGGLILDEHDKIIPIHIDDICADDWEIVGQKEKTIRELFVTTDALPRPR